MRIRNLKQKKKEKERKYDIVYFCQKTKNKKPIEREKKKRQKTKIMMNDGGETS